MTIVASALTGDLIASTEAGAVRIDRAMEVLAEAAAHMSDWGGADTRFTRYRGDGWQIYLDFPGLVLRATLYLVARLKAAETGLATRISVAIGHVERLGDTGLSSATGEVFITAGQNLDDMPRTARLALGGRTWTNKWQVAIFDLVDWQSRRWTREQAEAVAMALDPQQPTHGELAGRLGITRQAVQARLSGAGFTALEGALLAFEGTEWREEPA